MAEVTITPEALDQAARLPLAIQGPVRRLMLRLQDWPAVSGAKPLAGKLSGHYRLRTGAYRVQFQVMGERVVVVKIGHRDGFYED